MSFILQPWQLLLVILTGQDHQTKLPRLKDEVHGSPDCDDNAKSGASDAAMRLSTAGMAVGRPPVTSFGIASCSWAEYFDYTGETSPMSSSGLLEYYKGQMSSERSISECNRSCSLNQPVSNRPNGSLRSTRDTDLSHRILNVFLGRVVADV